MRGPGGGDRRGRGPGSRDFSGRRRPPCQPGGGVQDAVENGLGLGPGRVAVEGDLSEPGQQGAAVAARTDIGDVGRLADPLSGDRGVSLTDVAIRMGR
jgi:hypothetical protein